MKLLNLSQVVVGCIMCTSLCSADNPWPGGACIQFAKMCTSTPVYHVPDGRLSNMSLCPTSTGAWVTERVGYYHTPGGFTHINIDHIFDTKSLKQVVRMPWAALVARKYFLGPSSEHFEPILSPPIFVHHLFISKYFTFFTQRLFSGGDSQCLAAEGGVQKFSCGELPDEYALELPEKLHLQTDMYDVRPSDAIPLKWCVQLTMYVESRRGRDAKLVSGHSFYNPAKDLGAPMIIPRHHDSFFFYAGALPLNGTMLFITLGTHSEYLRTALLAGIHPAQIGLSGAGKECASEAISIDENERYYATVDAALPPSKVICTAHTRSEIIQAYTFDRCPNVTCRPWTFARNDPFTVLMFFSPLGPKTPQAIRDPIDGWTDDEHVPMHVQWNMVYTSSDGSSYFTAQSYNHLPGTVGPSFSWYDALRNNHFGCMPSGRVPSIGVATILLPVVLHVMPVHIHRTWPLMVLAVGCCWALCVQMSRHFTRAQGVAATAVVGIMIAAAWFVALFISAIHVASLPVDLIPDWTETPDRAFFVRYAGNRELYSYWRQVQHPRELQMRQDVRSAVLSFTTLIIILTVPCFRKPLWLL
jgi:hypothetical protein